MSSSIHLDYNFNDRGLPQSSNRWLYSELVVTKPLIDYYYSTLNHRVGYAGFQTKDHYGKYVSQFQCSNWDNDQGHAGHQHSKMVFCGKGVECIRFGHEGKGWQTHFTATNLRPYAGMKVANMVRFENAGGGKARITCWFQADELHGGKWFKQAVWEGAAGGGGGSHCQFLHCSCENCR